MRRLKERKSLWEEKSLRRNTLYPNESKHGFVSFFLDKTEAKELTFYFPVEKTVFKFKFKIIRYKN